MNAKTKEKRLTVKATVDSAYRQLSELVKGDFSPGYFNRPAVLQAEKQGLEVCDAILGHVLNAPKSPDRKAAALELLKRIEKGLINSEVQNQCHSLHGAVALMLDKIGCPAVVIWGSLNAIAPGSTGFRLIGEGAPQFLGHRPGHSWLLTPYWSVVDLALAHQYGVGDDYESLKKVIPKLILVSNQENSEPDRAWLQSPGQPNSSVPELVYCNATKYFDVIGWSKYQSDYMTIMYIPGAVCIPTESELDEINIRIGGKPPGEFLAENFPA